MKNLHVKSAFLGVFFLFFSISCKKIKELNNQRIIQMKPVYSSITEFKRGLALAVNEIRNNQIDAYLDTLPNGKPDQYGRKQPLAYFGYQILEQLEGNEQQIKKAVYDVFHFDGATFSLVSFIMKAQMAGDISAQTMVNILSQIPLPPIAVVGFKAPEAAVVPIEIGDDCCDDCNPAIRILVTWAYKTPCGNYERETSGYAANNTLSNMSGGRAYRFDAEISGCDCPGGILTSTVTAPAGAAYATGPSAGGGVMLFPQSSGTYTITFTYKICGKTVSKTFTLTVK
ncbi:MAG: hypothetical protein K2Q24_15910 [Chitinophagaceae bacterium]|jgi:hypothetical protein|nr:hypothetical protein [Chitinophagaceae bacterium]